MYKLFNALLSITWVLDVCDIPQLDFLDTTISINTIAWLLIWIVIPSTYNITKKAD